MRNATPSLPEAETPSVSPLEAIVDAVSLSMANLLSPNMARACGFVTSLGLGFPPARAYPSDWMMLHQSNKGATMAYPPKSMADFSEFGKLFADMKLPAMPDMEAFVSASRRNMESLTAANRVALEGAQAVARRHMEIVQQNMADMSEAVRAMSSVEAPQAKAAKQAELLKQAYERAVANMKEIGDLISQSNAEAVNLLNARFTEAMDEVKALANHSKT
jgi:phasin family protein